MQVRAGGRHAELEPLVQRRAEHGDRMDVVAEAGDHSRVVVFLLEAEGLTLVEPPLRRSHIEARDVELVDHQRPAAPDELGQVRARLGERLDVVERDDRHGRVVGAVGVKQRDRLDATVWLRGRIDRSHVEACLAKRRGELAAPRAHLEHTGRGLWKRSGYE